MTRIGLTFLALAAPLATQAQSGFDCLIEPSQVVEVRSPVDGLIGNIYVKRGDSIRRGQTLLELQSGAERAAVEGARYRATMDGQIASAKNRVQYATAKLARLAELQAGNFASAQARDEADAERRLAESELLAATESRELAKIDLRRAQEQLALRTMYAPFNGVVLDRMLNPGDLAESGSGRKPALKIAQIDPLKVDIVVPAAGFSAAKVGAKVTVVPKGLSGKYAATVTMVDKVIDAASGTFVMRVDLPNPTGAIPGGVRCNAEVDGMPAGLTLRPMAPKSGL
jgi:RND family efflux transporter MFP subunit